VKIAISATGPNLDAEVDPRFGRCAYFIIVDPETMEFEALNNSSAMAGGGAGISAGQTIASKGVQAVLTGNCGPNAYQVLSAAGLQVITGVSGKIRDVAQAYKSGRFQASSEPNVADHFGMGMSTGMGMGMGMGGGMGRGMGKGRGMGRGMGGGMGGGMMSSIDPTPQTPGELAQKLSEVQRRIEELEKKRQ